MRCSNCDANPETPDKPNYCPECGREFEKKSTDDVEWPLHINTAKRLNLQQVVSENTGIEQPDLWGFSDDVEILFDIIVNEDGSVEMAGDSR